MYSRHIFLISSASVRSIPFLSFIEPIFTLNVTALFYLEDSKRIHPPSMRACQPKDAKRREWRSGPVHGRERQRGRAHACGGRGGGGERKPTHVGEREREKEPTNAGEREGVRALGSSFYIFFLPPGPALCKLGLVRSAVLPEVLTLVLEPSFDLPLFYFCRFFSSLSFSHRHFELLFSILTTSQ